MSLSEHDLRNEPVSAVSGMGLFSNAEVKGLRETIAKERRAAGDALLALNAKQDELVNLRRENDRLRVTAIEGAQNGLDLKQLQASIHILRTELDTADANNRAYKRANWLLLIVCAGLVFSLLKGN